MKRSPKPSAPSAGDLLVKLFSPAGHTLFSHTRWFGKRLAVIDDQGSMLTYESLDHLCLAQAVRLIPGQVALLLCANTLDCLIFYLACHRAYAVPLLMPADLGLEQVRRLCEHYHPAMIFCATARPDLEALLPGLGRPGKFLLTHWRYEQAHPDLRLLLSTSGSTGALKTVRLSAQNLESNANSIISYLQLDGRERALTVLPMHYSYGLSVIHTTLLSGGILLMTTHSLMQKQFWDFASEYGATSLSGVPYTYTMLERLKNPWQKLPKLTTLCQAGGALSVSAIRRVGRLCEESGRRFFVMYGQTEASPRLSYVPPPRCVEKAGSIGIPIPGVSMSIEEGELVCRGENIALGYAENSADLLLGDDFQGVLYTGDLGFADDEGYFYLTGRRNRFVKLYGNRVSLDECERLLTERFPQLNCACVGMDDRLVICREDKGADGAAPEVKSSQSAELKRYLSRTLGLNAKAFLVREFDTLPRTSSGKLAYAQLKAALEDKV